MNKYVVIYPYSDAPPSEERMQAWMAWFETIRESVVDGGNPFGGGAAETTNDGAVALTDQPGRAGGYSIFNAASIDDAIALLADCPITSGVRVYEALAM
mgnify:CR=1 FL=1